MKYVYLLCILVLPSANGFAQFSRGFLLNFEDTSLIQTYYYTDSLMDSAGIWQIGRPAKALFDSAYASDSAIVTELDSLLPGGIRASFAVTNIDSAWWGRTYPVGGQLTFIHKYDFDSAHGGGYVEYSVDSGSHWHPVSTKPRNWYYYYPIDDSTGCLNTNMVDVDGQSIFPPIWVNSGPTDTTSSGIPYFTGTDTTWHTDTIGIATYVPVKTSLNSGLLFRFTAYTDTNAVPKEGWLIDNIRFRYNAYRCYGGVAELSSSHLSISPNPASGAFQITLTDQQPGDYMVTLTDLTGREVMRRSFSGAEATLYRDGLAAGSYVVRVVSERTGDSFTKQLIFQ